MAVCIQLATAPRLWIAIQRCKCLALPGAVTLIAGVISSIDLELYKKSTGVKIESPLWLDQPDIRQPRSVTIALVDSLLFYGVAYWRVTSLYADLQDLLKIVVRIYQRRKLAAS
jgi:hypothetical protein